MGKMKKIGTAIKLGDNINTDLIISGRYKFAITDMKVLAKHIFEDLDPKFYEKIKPQATFLVAGENFGLGSSREQAPLVIKESGIIAVIAKSFARIFYRNAINVGLTLLEADTEAIANADQLSWDPAQNLLENLTRQQKVKHHPISQAMKRILDAGGLLAYIEKQGGLKI
jgi:3-isopropylmalate/(R)-2-methylmalate dehydratase small subunit